MKPGQSRLDVEIEMHEATQRELVRVTEYAGELQRLGDALWNEASMFVIGKHPRLDAVVSAWGRFKNESAALSKNTVESCRLQQGAARTRASRGEAGPQGEGVSEKLAQVGRLALRQEGQLWVAYYAEPGTMDGALYLGSIQMALVDAKPDRRKRFMDLMRDGVADIIEENVGMRPVWPDGEKPAPEHERGVGVPNPFLK